MPTRRRARLVQLGPDDVSQQPGNSFRYLYERLGEKRFQQLCSALLAHVFPDITCYPVGQADGGRDAVQKLSDGDVIYQVKWTSKRQQDPVAWLTKAIDGEKANIERLVQAGASRYYLLTSIAGTSGRNKGTMDRLDKELVRLSTVYKVPMTCWWQADIDARVDAAPRDLKWAYPEMLAGTDAVLYVRDADVLVEQDRQLTTMLRNVVATQWREDARVKFKQVELDSHDLSTLFIDVEAIRTISPRRAGELLPTSSETASLGGAAQYLITTSQPFTVVRGEPGQGKSTLGQYVCQIHRAQFLRAAQLVGARRPGLHARQPRLPIRVDLRDYATWLTGEDPFSEDDQAVRSRRPPLPTMEMFLCHLFTVRSGGTPATAIEVQDILHRFPMLIVLDGLDEVAQPSVRKRIVIEIDEFTARLAGSVSTPQVIVTTRPNAAQLPEPSTDTFETIALVRLSERLRKAYLMKWADAQRIQGRDRRALQRTFNSRASEPHISQLADNPMQLTILLYLMQRLGESVPPSRTGLYTEYMDTFLHRESEKFAAVRDNRSDLEEVTAFLGWHLQARAETDGDKARMSARAIQAAINSYLFSVDKRTSHVAELFTAVTDRVWALTSKVDGYFEFDVQSLREYFAARFLWEYAGGSNDFDPSTVLRHLIRRPYWLNTSRFYAGFARPNELSDLVDSMSEEFSDTPRASQIRAAAWTLLTDGVFSRRAPAEKRAATLFADDLSVLLLTHTLLTTSSLNTSLPPTAATALVGALRQRTAAIPAAAVNTDRMNLAAKLQPSRSDFDSWWTPHMTAAAGTADEGRWLQFGVAQQGAARLPRETASRLMIPDPAAAAAALAAGLSAEPGSAQEHTILQAVLDGHCSDTETTAHGLPADLIRLCAPKGFLTKAVRNLAPYRAPVGHAENDTSRHHRPVLARLAERDERYAQLGTAMRYNRGESGTTSPWGNSARTLASILGPCWLATEIAVIGATIPDRVLRTGGSTTQGAKPLGHDRDYGRLLQDIRRYRSQPAWWADTHTAWADADSRATWALALVSAATASVVTQHLELFIAVVEDLPDQYLTPLLASSSRIGTSQIHRELPITLIGAATRSPYAALLVAHHAADPSRPVDLGLDLNREQIAIAGVAAWPATHSRSGRLVAEPNGANLRALTDLPYPSQVPVTANLAEPLLSEILDNAARYPAVWVLAADRQRSQRLDDPPLNAVADDEEWLPS